MRSQANLYVITNETNGKQYVGITSQTIAVRWSAHRCDARRGIDRPLYRAIRKYGEGSFSIKHVACSSTYEDGLSAEVALIEQHCSIRPHGYNLTAGGEGGRRTQETIEKGRQRTSEQWAGISQEKRLVRLANCHTAAARAKGAETRKSQGGYCRTPEQNAAHGDRLRGRAWAADDPRRTDPARSAKISAGLKGRERSAEHRAALSAAMKGRSISACQRDKQALGMKRHWENIDPERKRDIYARVSASSIRRRAAKADLAYAIAAIDPILSALGFGC